MLSRVQQKMPGRWVGPCGRRARARQRCRATTSIRLHRVTRGAGRIARTIASNCLDNPGVAPATPSGSARVAAGTYLAACEARRILNMIKKTRKLTLRRETVKALQSDDLRGIAGGQEISGGGYCPTQGCVYDSSIQPMLDAVRREEFTSEGSGRPLAQADQPEVAHARPFIGADQQQSELDREPTAQRPFHQSRARPGARKRSSVAPGASRRCLRPPRAAAYRRRLPRHQDQSTSTRAQAMGASVHPGSVRGVDSR